MGNPSHNKALSDPTSCFHCGVTARMIIICEGDHKKMIKIASPGELSQFPEGIELEHSTTWQVLLCAACEKPNVIQDVHFVGGEYDEYEGSDGEFYYSRSQTTVLYPVRKFVSLPRDVAKAYEASVTTFYASPSAFVLMARRTLEFMCIDRKANGYGLRDKLKDLSKRGELPQILSDAAEKIKEFGDASAHRPDSEFSQDEAQIIRDLCDAILEHIYEAPALVSRVRENIQKLKRSNP